MKDLPVEMVFTLLERGPVTLVTTGDAQADNVMTVTWTMVLDYRGRFAITTGPWNHSFKALTRSRECVVAIPGTDLLDAAVEIGVCTGASTDKFAKLSLARRPADHVAAPLIEACIANIECRVLEIIEPHNIIILEAVAAHVRDNWQAERMLHAVGDGTFVADGEGFDRRAAMQAKLPPGI
ncbi:flavin reductase (DIM6/NTAB) family NADH-FMN oxidoreductase RutF [Phenylobacterium haematophilum]|uniref:Flavin reductase (DIM6/NTAB) family NADH-FMN oxidoreductase RutF n=1 Tax=Phenylobacterium haematophilum TaxID=98513 RepID=A0A839ZZB7_9CAUL|nr:flavin reductase family protein [Phenylobacterium haematophilum]MBB3890590.1 flavin reductase (DIM6/NTAB) family NADH-FMN oxidoreductase RutF [Phenylobacterium haematophilum]